MDELIFIGLGLWDERSITLRALRTARDCDKLFAEFYTSRLAGTTKKKLEELFDKRIKVLTREQVEESDILIEEAKKGKIGFLVPGDPMCATTHIALRLRAMELGIKIKIIPGISILTSSAGLAGLSHYKFGRVTTIPFPQKGYKPATPYQVIKKNRENNLHSLVLLELKNNKCLSPNKAIEILQGIEKERKEKVIDENTLMVVVSRAGGEQARVKVGKVKDLRDKNFGTGMHCLLIPGKLHFVEEDSLKKLKG